MTRIAAVATKRNPDVMFPLCHPDVTVATKRNPDVTFATKRNPDVTFPLCHPDVTFPQGHTRHQKELATKNVTSWKGHFGFFPARGATTGMTVKPDDNQN
jgi:hypothetical protein